MEIAAFTEVFPGGRSTVIETFCMIGKPFVASERKRGESIGGLYTKAIWDTGATHSTISTELIRKLGVKRIGTMILSSLTGQVESGIYEVSISLPGGVCLCKTRVAEGEIDGHGALIGMDIITLGDLSITSKDGNTMFSFQMPHTHSTDYEAECELMNKQGITPVRTDTVNGRSEMSLCAFEES
jgi:predicted aspartyl protease